MATATACRPMNVLIVEDNVDAAVTFQALFHVHGHNALIAQDGEEAVEMAHVNPIDVVICDLGLPKMDGFEVVKSLRADPALPYLPVCALTARSDAESRRKAAAAGFDGYIVKPPTFPDLLAFLRRYQR
jgi:CheY-like chemotaxis protein